MTNKLITFYFLTISILFGQSHISYDLSDQFGVALDNNQIVWNSDKNFDDLLIDRSSTYFKNKFSSFNFDNMPTDSVYVKSKFQYEFGDYGFDKLNIGLKKHSEKSDFEFTAMKKSFFGTYAEFANQDSSPLSLFYKADYTTNLSNGNLYFSIGYFREDSKFLFDVNSDISLEGITNKEFSDFLSFTAGSILNVNGWSYNFELNHINKYTDRVITQYNINHEIDIDRNRFNVSANNGKNVSITSFIDNAYYFDHNNQKGYSRNILQLSNSNKFSFGDFTYGIDYIADKAAPNISYEANFGTVGLYMSRENKPNMVLFDRTSPFQEYLYHPENHEKVQNWDSFILSYNLFAVDLDLNFVRANNLQAKYFSDLEIADSDGYFSFSDDMLSLKTKVILPFKNSKIDIVYYHNFYDSLISSNRSDILDLNYYFKTSFVDEKLGIDGKLSLRYLSKNDSGYSFDYFRNIPISHNHISYDESYNIGLDLNVSIADVILTIRLKNALDRLPIDGNYSLNNSDLFNPMNSLLSFGIIWEFDD